MVQIMIYARGTRQNMANAHERKRRATRQSGDHEHGRTGARPPLTRKQSGQDEHLETSKLPPRRADDMTFDQAVEEQEIPVVSEHR